MHSRRVSVVLAFVSLVAASCAPTVKSAAREASQAAVDQSVTELNREETKRDLMNAVEDPRLAEATAKIGEQIADGVVRGLASPGTQQKLTQVAGAAANAATRQMVQTLDSEASREAFASIAQGLANGLADPKLQSSLTRTAQAAALGAVNGANEGLTTAWYDADAGPVAGLRNLTHGSGGWLAMLITLAGLVTLALLCGAIIVVGQGRSARHQAARLEGAALLLTKAVELGRDHPESQELLRLAKRSLERDTRADLARSGRPWRRRARDGRDLGAPRAT
ncbi:MAG: hypothetical protein QM778_15875 [Myxococcales bacterium]